MPPKRIHITKDDQGWKGKAEGATRASVRGSTQHEVERAVKQQLRNNPGGGEAITHRGDNNRIRSSDTINRPDPNPPRDTEH